MKTVSTKKSQIKDEELKAFIVGVRGDFAAFLQLVKADKKASLTQEETDYWCRAYAERAASLFQQRIESDCPGVSLDFDSLSDCLYRILSRS